MVKANTSGMAQPERHDGDVYASLLVSSSHSPLMWGTTPESYNASNYAKGRDPTLWHACDLYVDNAIETGVYGMTVVYEKAGSILQSNVLQLQLAEARRANVRLREGRDETVLHARRCVVKGSVHIRCRLLKSILGARAKQCKIPLLALPA